MRIWLLAAGLVLTSVSASLASDWHYDSKKPMPFGKSATNASEFALQEMSAKSSRSKKGKYRPGIAMICRVILPRI
jgi:hypothetical protein